MVSCGEASGDLYAGELATQLRAREPGIELIGLGGPRLRAAGAALVGDIGALSVTGMTGALRVVPRSIGLIRRLTAAARARRPDVLVVIDAPDFHFPLMWAFRHLGIPIIYYVSPQLWAWRRGRLATMKQRAAKVLVIFPFEEELYRAAGVPVQFVGHPLVDLARARESRPVFLRAFGLVPEAPTIALLPGSRRNELHRIAPTMAQAMPLIRARVPGVQFVIAGAPNLPDDLFAPLLDGRPVLVRERTDDALNACDIAITASGTATVQCALHERPMVVVYRLSGFDYQVARRFVKLKDVAMPNLLAGRRIVPELIQGDFTPERVAAEAVTLLTDARVQQRTREALREVREQLGTSGASGRAADAVLDLARRR